MQIPVHFKNKRNLTLRGSVYVPRKHDTAIILLHGFPGHCSAPARVRLAKALRWLGYLVLNFDFSGTDTSDGKFEAKLMSDEVEDIRSAIDFLQKKYSFKHLVLIGHSTGAIDAALYAHMDKRVSKLVLLGGEGNLKDAVHYDFTDDQIHEFKTKGFIVYRRPENWVHGKKLKKAFYDEFFKLDVLGSLHKFKRPVLIVHGEKDKDVPAEKDPQELYRAANGPKKLVIIRGADHRFSKLWHGLQVLYHISRFIRNN